mmetsp:Transcript_8356/g.25028  ORF Transcript_8356/g.25028 Transcript_8356/m.25028 type:complete len:254 (-) Transcript_8356:1698-2459(-)
MEDSAMEKAGIWAPSTPEAMLPATAHGISGRFSFSSRENDAFDLAWRTSGSLISSLGLAGKQRRHPVGASTSASASSISPLPLPTPSAWDDAGSSSRLLPYSSASTSSSVTSSWSLAWAWRCCCSCTSVAYAPPGRSCSSACDPVSTTLPRCITAIWFTCLMVLRRWATMMVVILPPISLSRAFCTTLSDVLSRADVASSRRRIAGFLRIARAMAMRCFWPPLIWEPSSPVLVSYPLGSLEMKVWQFAARAAA